MIEVNSTIIKNKINYPKLMVASSKEGDTIVLMLDETGKGNGIASSHPSWEFKGVDLFYTTGQWNFEEFKDYNEELTIKNK